MGSWSGGQDGSCVIGVSMGKQHFLVCQGKGCKKMAKKGLIGKRGAERLCLKHFKGAKRIHALKNFWKLPVKFFVSVVKALRAIVGI